MMKRGAGYVLAIVGIVVILAGVGPIYENIKGSVPESISSNNIIVAGIAIFIIGIALTLSKNRGKQPAEVPIYHGRNVVGYRRMGKKR